MAVGVGGGRCRVGSCWRLRHDGYAGKSHRFMTPRLMTQDVEVISLLLSLQVRLQIAHLAGSVAVGEVLKGKGS